jgi:hypothetical protein
MGADLYIRSIYNRQSGDEGYFRDPYNDCDLLWQFGLSWWKHILPRLGQDNTLAVSDAEWLLDQLKRRENIFQQNIAEMSAEVQDLFRTRYQGLQKFLNSAIERKEPILALCRGQDGGIAATGGDAPFFLFRRIRTGGGNRHKPPR